MKILASYNIKGGVGKTAAAVNLAYCAAREGARTLIWDLDPQGAATFYLRIKPKIKGGGKALLTRKREVDSAIKASNYPNLDVLPADFSYRNMDLVLDDVKHQSKRLLKLLRPLSEEYDYVFLDCPPSISLVSENIFHAADALLVPTIPTPLSLHTLEQLIGFCIKYKLYDLQILPFLSMVDRRKGLHRNISDHPPALLSNMLLSVIPYATEVEQMGEHREPIGEFAATSRAAQSFAALWQEIQQRMVTTKT
jgi:chromosome partitioning protein